MDGSAAPLIADSGVQDLGVDSSSHVDLNGTARRASRSSPLASGVKLQNIAEDSMLNEFDPTPRPTTVMFADSLDPGTINSSARLIHSPPSTHSMITSTSLLAAYSGVSSSVPANTPDRTLSARQSVHRVLGRKVTRRTVEFGERFLFPTITHGIDCFLMLSTALSIVSQTMHYTYTSYGVFYVAASFFGAALDVVVVCTYIFALFCIRQDRSKVLARLVEALVSACMGIAMFLCGITASVHNLIAYQKQDLSSGHQWITAVAYVKTVYVVTYFISFALWCSTGVYAISKGLKDSHDLPLTSTGNRFGVTTPQLRLPRPNGTTLHRPFPSRRPSGVSPSDNDDNTALEPSSSSTRKESIFSVSLLHSPSLSGWGSNTRRASSGIEMLESPASV